MSGVLVVTILLWVGCMSEFENLVKAQDGCISHPLPPEVVDKIVDAANIAIRQSNENNSCSTKRNNDDTVDGHALAILGLLQTSLSATKEEFSASKLDWENVSSSVTELTERTKVCENVSSTVTELTERTKVCENAVTSISSLQSSLSSTQIELTSSKRDFSGGLTEIQSTLTILRNELDELRKNLENVTSKLEKCKHGWFLFQNSCYFLSNSTANWESGRQQCLNMGADYVKISTDEEFASITSHVVESTWVGLNDLQVEGTFKWISDGTVHEINRTWWGHKQPDNHKDEEDCVHINVKAGKLLNDLRCNHSLLYICEMMVGTNIN